MSNKMIEWGILGSSPISDVMANAIRESSLGELVAIGSRSADTAKAFADKYQIPKAYNDYHSLLSDPDIDAVYIGLPNHLHKEWIIHCAQAGKHILCEKPFVTSQQDAQEVFAILEKANVFCMEALMYRCHPFTKKLQALIEANTIGEIKLFKSVYTANIAEIANKTMGGSILNLGCYPISLVRLLANSEPIDMVSLGRINKTSGNDNQASTILRFENDMMAVVSTADDIDMFWQFDVYGTQGQLKVITNPWLPGLEGNKVQIFREGNDRPDEISVLADKSLYTYQIDTVNQHILAGECSSISAGISWKESLGNVKVLETWLQQVKGIA